LCDFEGGSGVLDERWQSMEHEGYTDNVGEVLAVMMEKDAEWSGG